MRGKNLIGQTFGYLTVVNRAEREKNTKRKRIQWQCNCKCGNTVVVSSHKLLGGNTKSCGCYKAERQLSVHWKGYKEIGSTMWSNYKCHAASRNLVFEITIEYAWMLYEQQNRQCSLTNLPIGFGKKGKSTASLDRIDSTKGYVEGNVQWVHKDVNRMKMDLEQTRLICLCHLVAANHPLSIAAIAP